MTFWDTSAIVPLCVIEPATARVRSLATADPSRVVWWATRTECLSAMARRRRDGQLSPRRRSGPGACS
ncbi:MAG: type II toxin-antitoxin system VapC family toxin [Candidatus Binatia bacterium]